MVPSPKKRKLLSGPKSDNSDVGAPLELFKLQVDELLAETRPDRDYGSFHNQLQNTAVQCNGYADCCVLGSIWLRQRGFGSSHSNGGFGGTEWASAVAVLLQDCTPSGHSVLLPRYSNYQLFKATLQFLASRDLIESPLYFQAREFSRSQLEHPIFVDGNNGINIMSNMTPWSYERLRFEASESLKLLKEETSDKFQPLFIARADVEIQKYDILLRIPLSSLTQGKTTSDIELSVIECCGELYKVLKQGLGDRVKLINIMIPDISARNRKLVTPGSISSNSIQIGFLLEPLNATRAVDHGPPAENKSETAAYRKFWGEKAELRRFKDGSITESLVWSSKRSSRPIIEQIVLYLLERHFSQGFAHTVSFLRYPFEEILSGDFNESRPLEEYAFALEAFNTFEKDVRNLEGLPLHLRQLSPVSSVLRYTSIDPLPMGQLFQSIRKPIDVLIQFEGSTRWPDELIAIQQTKIAILLKISEMLGETGEYLMSRVGLENERSSLLNRAFLDVQYPNGISFRVRIHCEREEALLDRKILEKGLDPLSSESASLARAVYHRHYIQAPLHTQAIRSLSTRYPALSPTIRITKMWFASHLLNPHIREELIELLCVRTFIQPYPWSPPATIQTGFLRTLAFLAKWDWRDTPLILDFGSDTLTKDMSQIMTRFHAWRKADPGMHQKVIFAATNFDPAGWTWTDSKPSKVVATRMTALARAACAVIGEENSKLDTKRIFAHSLLDYDFVIHIRPEFLTQMQEGDLNQPMFKNLQAGGQKDKHYAGYQPLRLYLEELQSLYSSNVLFFSNHQTGSVIGGLWNPQTGPRPFKVNCSYSTMPTINKSAGTDLMTINRAAILNEIAHLGGDMVAKLEEQAHSY